MSALTAQALILIMFKQATVCSAQLQYDHYSYLKYLQNLFNSTFKRILMDIALKTNNFNADKI